MKNYGIIADKALVELANYDFSGMDASASPRYSLFEAEGILLAGALAERMFYSFSDSGKCLLKGILMYRNGKGLREQNFDFGGLEHDCGVALYFTCFASRFICVDITDAKSISDIINKVVNSRANSKGLDSSRVHMFLSNTFTKEDIEDLIAEFESINLSPSIIKDAKKAFAELNGCKDRQKVKEEWIEKGYPCSRREGFSYRGAEVKGITNKEALREIDKCFEFRFESIKGEPNLVLQFYGENDLY